MAKFAVFWELPQTVFRLKRRFHGNRRLDGQIVVITGGSSGIGKETAYQMSLRGPKIIIGARNMEKADEAIKEINGRNPKANITALKLDLSSLKSVREFARQVAEQETTVDVLINNAGVPLPCPELRSPDNFELQLASNYLGHYLLTLHLLPLMKRSPNARIINVVTSGYVFGQIFMDNINLDKGAYGSMKAHLQSKLALVLFTRELARRLGGTESTVKTYCLNPGGVNARSTGNVFLDFIKRLFMLNIDMGPQTYLYCALDEQLDKESGRYYDNCSRVDRMASQATDDKLALDLWKLTTDLVQLEDSLKL
ncbi:retinol dehydrogenase 13-like [Oppia nitens]|uniref:retinol dehydrogenase 13-like n=1 Tax=Oppia nitens TaxID=1686743 RepID=UPI0023DA2F1D|nr:retinol dehydrogenase 13-like [Oppia nitens]